MWVFGTPVTSLADLPSVLHPEGLRFLEVRLGWSAHKAHHIGFDPRKQEIRISMNPETWIWSCHDVNRQCRRPLPGARRCRGGIATTPVRSPSIQWGTRSSGRGARQFVPSWRCPILAARLYFPPLRSILRTSLRGRSPGTHGTAQRQLIHSFRDPPRPSG
jgi:hypothetical protein